MPNLQSLDAALKRDPNLRYRYDQDLKVVTSLRGDMGKFTQKDLKKPEAVANRFIREHPDLFGDQGESKVSVIRESKDDLGGSDLIMQQYLGQYQVMGGSVHFHWNSQGVLNSVTNHLFPDLGKASKRPRFSQEKAVEAAFKATKAKGELGRDPEMLIYRYEGKPRLAYDIRINDEKAGESGAPARWVVLVDASDGKILLRYDNVQTAGSVVGVGTGYYSGAGNVNAFFDDSTYQLLDTTRTGAGGPEVRTDDEDGASPSEDADNDWDDTTTTPRDHNQGAEVDAHRFAADVVDYFQVVHGRNSFDGSGAQLRTIVHVGTDYNNGYWDGSKVNLGDGDNVQFDYCTSDDWLAHEFTHAYTQYTCGLVYSYESGALNEAFSDIFAAFITGDWMVFEDNWLSSTAPAARNMIDPTNGGQWNPADAITCVLAGHQPSHYSERYTGSWDNGGVHINSGIINHLFYLLVNGGTHAISGITVSAIGQSAAEQMLFRCMTVNLFGNPTADFLDFREAMLDACQDLFPYDLFKLSQVKNAFLAVGIGPDLYVRDNLADSGLEPYPGSYLWASPDVINRTSPSADPTADFADMNDDMLWQNVEFGQNNHVYVRLQNRGSSVGDATISVYFIGLTSFGTPSSWIHIGSTTEMGIAPGTVCIAGPITFPKALIPSPGHYCMIAVITDMLDPAPDHYLITSVSDYLDFVRNSNNIAYRNMNVVDLVPGIPAVIEFEMGAFEGIRQRYQLELDMGHAPMGVRVRLRGPRRALDGAIARGLKLVARQREDNIYELEVGQQLIADLGGMAYLKPGTRFIHGFEDVLLEKPIKMAMELLVPKEFRERRYQRLFRNHRQQIVMRQMVDGRDVGAFSLRLRLGKE